MEFKKIPCFPDHEISKDGVIRRRVAGKTRPVGWIVKTTLCKSGYLRVKLTYQQMKYTALVHRLVLWTWGSNPRPDDIARHLDGNPLNNHIDNLAWGSQKDNLDDRRRHGRSFDGNRNPNAKLTLETVEQIRSDYTGKHGDYAKLSRKYDVSYSQLVEIIKGQSWVM